MNHLKKKIHVRYDRISKNGVRKWCVWCDCCYMLTEPITTYDDFAVSVGSHGVVKFVSGNKALAAAARHTSFHHNTSWISDIW